MSRSSAPPPMAAEHPSSAPPAPRRLAAEVITPAFCTPGTPQWEADTEPWMRARMVELRLVIETRLADYLRLQRTAAGDDWYQRCLDLYGMDDDCIDQLIKLSDANHDAQRRRYLDAIRESYVDRAGQPISEDDYGRLMFQVTYWSLADTRVRGVCRVVTRWDGRVSIAQPHPFKTSVRNVGKGQPWQTRRRYMTEAEALAGHAEVVAQQEALRGP